MISEGERVLVYDPDHADTRAPLSRLRAELEQLCWLKEGVDARLATLPPDALEARELFGAELSEDFLTDNCHLSVHGAAQAARAVATRIMERLR